MTIGIDSNDNVFLSGFFKGSVDFLSGIGTDIYTSAGGHDMCISKYTAEGDYLWTKIIGSTQDDYGFFLSAHRMRLLAQGISKGM